MAKGEFRSDLPPDIITFGILGMANWSYFWFNPAGKMLSDRQVSEIFHQILIGGIQQQVKNNEE